MAREIVVRLGEETSRFGFTKVDRAKLYGRRVRRVEDEEGRDCVAAQLTLDGAALVPPGGAAYLYVDESWDTVERSELRAVDEAGEALEPFPSTLGVEQPLEPARPERILDHTITSVYELSAEELGEALRTALADGELFEAHFSYRDGYRADRLFILQNDEGVFGLVGRSTDFGFLRREALVEDDEDDDDEDDDDLDFSMF